MYKKVIVLLVCAAALLSFASCGAKESTEGVFALVENHYDEIVAACERKDAQALLAIDGISRVQIVDGYVLVYCQGAGISPSSRDYGFYYTEGNIPVGVDCNLDIVCYRDAMQPKGNGYEGTVRGNRFYTEHIKGNLYLYSNAY